MKTNTPGFFALAFGLAIVSGMVGFYLHQVLQGHSVRDGVEKTAVLRIGDQRPDFSLADLDGQLQHIAQWDGNILLINFWASWCPPCVREIPALQKIHRDYHEKGVQVIGIALDEPGNIRDFLHDKKVTYPQLYGQRNVSQLMKQLGNQHATLPFTIVIGRDGAIAGVAPRGELDYQQIQGLLVPLLALD